MRLLDRPGDEPDIKSIYYVLESGDVDDLFTLTSDGILTLRRDASNASGDYSEYTLEISGRASWPTAPSAMLRPQR